MITVHTLEALPKAKQTYVRILKSLVRRQNTPVKTLPSLVYEVPRLVIDEQNLIQYRKVCGFAQDGRVPPTYFAVLSQALQMTMMTQDDFPFVMLGLVHIDNSVCQKRIIYDTEVIRMRVTLGNLSPHPKGQQFDFCTQVYAQETLIWSGTSTYLVRQNQQSQSKPTALPKLAKTQTAFSTTIFAPHDIGRRYAFVSNDFNPIHLHPLTARAFGYSRAIAHGLWTKARCLACLDLPPAFECRTQFRSPLFLPSQGELVAVYDDKACQFGLYGTADKVHMVGEINPL